MHGLILKTSPLYLERRICCFVFCCLLCLCVFVCDCVCTCVSAVAGGKPAIYWPRTETQPGSLFLVFGQRLEMNQRTVSQSATIRSTEISDVSLLHAALLQLAAHLILIYFFFFFPPSPAPTPHPPHPPKLSNWLWVMGLRELTGTKKAAGTDPNTCWIIPEIHIRSLYGQEWHDNSVQLDGRLCAAVMQRIAPPLCSKGCQFVVSFYFYLTFHTGVNKDMGSN